VDGEHGMLGIAEVMHDNLAKRSKCLCQALRDLFELID
jgi:hypothetical protein